MRIIIGIHALFFSYNTFAQVVSYSKDFPSRGYMVYNGDTIKRNEKWCIYKNDTIFFDGPEVEVSEGFHFVVLKNDTINIQDSLGRKQGRWIYSYETRKRGMYYCGRRKQRLFKKKEKFCNYKSWTTYLLNGEGYCLNDKRIGIWKSYYPSGETYIVANFDNGNLNGLIQIHHKNGNVKFLGYVTNDKVVELTEYDVNGIFVDKKQFPLDLIYSALGVW